MKYEFKTEPFVHQREVLKASWNRSFWAILCDRGTGKTKICLDTAGLLFEVEKSIDALFIVSLNGVHIQWVEEQIPMHLPDRIPRICRIWTGEDTKKFKAYLEDLWKPAYKDHLKIFAINVEAFQYPGRAQNFALHFLSSFRTLLALDESTSIKHISANRSKFLVNHLAPMAVYRRILTGNEITKTPFDTFSQYKFLSTEFWSPIPNFHAFKNRYGNFQVGQCFRKKVKVAYTCPKCRSSVDGLTLKKVSGAVFLTCPSCGNVCNKDPKLPKKARTVLNSDGKSEFPQLIGYKRMDDLKRRVMVCSSRVRKEDCLDLPPKIYETLYCEMNAEQKRVYHEVKESFYTQYKGHELVLEEKITLSLRLSQIVGGFMPETGEVLGPSSPKIDKLIYDLGFIEEDDPIIIWSKFRFELAGIKKALNEAFPDKNSELYFGDTTQEERTRIRNDFNLGKVHYFIANPDVGGTGLNLQRSCIQYNYSFSNRIENTWQAEDRTHRSGQKRVCLYKTLFIKGTIDEVVRKAQQEEKSMAEFFRTHPEENP